jgi:hypothetical protein
MLNNKYKAIKTGRFDSKFEAEVFGILQETFYSHKGDAKLEEKPSILIKPASDNFPKRVWKCDFRLTITGVTLNVEAKGKPTRDFRLSLEMLELFNREDFERLVIVFNNLDNVKGSTLDKLRKDGKILTISELESRINNLKFWLELDQKIKRLHQGEADGEET